MRDITNNLVWLFLVAALICDARFYRIPNQLIVLGYITGLYFNIVERGTAGIIVFAFNALWPILLLYLLYIFKGVGSGDLKIYSVIATMVGTKVTMDVIYYSIILGGIISVGLCLKERKIPEYKLHFSFYITGAFYLLHLWEELKI